MKRLNIISWLLILLITGGIAEAKTMTVPTPRWPNIRRAMQDAAFSGDIIELEPRTFTGPDNRNIDFQNKNVVIRSQTSENNPNWGTINSTIIDCQNAGRAFILQNNQDSNSKIVGITIINGHADGGRGADGNSPSCSGISIDPNRAPPGSDATGDGKGGAIICGNPDGFEYASPIIKNCVIKNCNAWGAIGGKGGKGCDAPYPGEPRNGQWGGHGGRGIGRGIGAAIACVGGSPIAKIGSNPAIINCVFMNNIATGGHGGDGGDGGNAAPGGLESGGGNGGTGIGDGQGGVVYFNNIAQPNVSGCTFINNTAKEGVGGLPGRRGSGIPYIDPPEPLDGIPGDSDSSDDHNEGNIAGGAMYCSGTNASWHFSLQLTGCTFTDNIAYNSNGRGGPLYTKGAAMYAGDNRYITLTRCDFINNLAGAVYCGFGGSMNISGTSEDKSVFSGNTNIRYGGAIYIDEGSEAATIENCVFINNSAYDDGGAVECRRSVKVTDCSFSDNIADSNGDEPGIGHKYGLGGGMDVYRGSTSVDANLTRCTFTGNYAEDGGGFSTSFFDANFNSCVFMNNDANSGGALSLDDGSFKIRGGVINGNRARGGTGGGISYTNPWMTAVIRDCEIRKNTAAGVFPDGIGGAIYYGRDTLVTNEVFNCLVADNVADSNGGGIYTHSAAPDITNCTFSNNTAGSLGGAIFADYDSEPNILNSIFHRCNKHAIHEEFPEGNAIAKYCLFYSNADGSYYDAGTNKVYDGSAGPNGVSHIPGGSDNLYGNPLFVTGILGEFYLRQTPGQPAPASPALNSGSGTAVSLGLNTYTTSTEEDNDTGTVDRGYHYVKSTVGVAYHLDTGVVGSGGTIAPPDSYYPAGVTVMLVATPDSGWRVKKWTGTINDLSTSNTNTVIMLSDKVVTVEFERYLFRLDTSVVGGVGGTIEPASGNYYNINSVVTLTAIPNAGWRVKKWTGTNDDSSTSNSNTVTMNSDKSVSVEFELLRTLTVGTHCDYPTIHEAIAAAKNGDTVLVSPGVWYGPETTINKSITVRSIDPNHPENTILNGAGVIARIFRFGSLADSGTVLDGFTLENCAFGGATMREPEDPRRDGLDGWPVEGGAIYIEQYAGPVIKNCIIRNNVIIGCHASSGRAATAELNAGRGGWSGWARGGGVFCAPNTKPTFINCQIIDNKAFGGNGGDGGSQAHLTWYPNYGGDWSRNGTPQDGIFYADSYSNIAFFVYDRPLYKMWRWDFGGYYVQYYPWLDVGDGSFYYYGDYRWFSGYGGGVYCDINSEVTFINCAINGNRTRGGLSGIAGAYEYLFDHGYVEPFLIAYQLPSYGGGVYCAAGSTVKFSGCAITDNVAVRPTPNETPFYHLDAHLGHGGGIAAEDTAAVIIENCLVSGNEAADGGGLWWLEANPKISNSSFVGNHAYEGGGLYGRDGTATINNCQIIGNEAFGIETDPNRITGVDPNLYDQNDNRYVHGYGGGIHCDSTVAKIADCNISGNTASDSGGGAYFIGENFSRSMLKNCLLFSNKAGESGGGVSNNSFHKLDVSICTIAYNTVNAVIGSGSTDYYGGGVSCSDRADTDIVHSIIWGNAAIYGPQMAVRRGAQGITTVDVNYSDVQGGAAGVYVDSGCFMRWYDDPNNLSGTSVDNPLFLGSYYLDQSNSHCVNFGNPAYDALHYGMYKHTTSTNKVIDTGRLDLGYHHILTTDLIGDFDFNGIVDLSDWVIFLSHWLDSGCVFPEWCNGTDLNQDGVVNFIDYTIFAQNYKETEKVAPQPNPMTWAIPPYPDTASSIKMKATKATDNSGSPVQYWFEEVTGNANGNDSGWQSDPNYTDADLSANTKYGYKVKARDTSNYTETDWSFIGYAVPGGGGGGGGGEVTIPAEPNNLTAMPKTSSNIILSWTDNANNETGFKIERKTGSGSYSQITAVTANTTDYNDTGLSPLTTYTYRVRAYNSVGDSNCSNEASAITLNTIPVAPSNLTATAVSGSQINLSWADNSTNETGFEIERKTGSGSFSQVATVLAGITTYSDASLSPLTAYTYRVRAYNATGNSSFSNEVSVTTPQEQDLTPPTPNPSEWLVRPKMITDAHGIRWITMQAVTATDAASPPVKYYFDCIDGYGTDSGWITDPNFTYMNGSHCTYVVKTKDNVGNVGQNSVAVYTGSP
jgi:parallel beta-helix repeat protein